MLAAGRGAALAALVLGATTTFTADAKPKAPIPLKEAKLNIEHNATDHDTGFQGAIDSDGWKRLDVTGPDGELALTLRGRGELADLGLTELFFETVEPENADTPIAEMLDKLEAGDYRIAGPAQENGENLGRTEGVALLTHVIPAGPRCSHPPKGPPCQRPPSWRAGAPW
jgi:hypothetical protein